MPSSHIARITGSLGDDVRTKRVVSMTEPRPPRPPCGCWLAAGVGPTDGAAEVPLPLHAASAASSAAPTRLPLPTGDRRITRSEIDDDKGPLGDGS